MLAEGDDDEEKPEAKQDFLHPVGNAIAKLTGQTQGLEFGTYPDWMDSLIKFAELTPVLNGFNDLMIQ